MDVTEMFLWYLGIKIRFRFFVAVKHTLQISSVLLYRKMATFDGLKVIFCYNSVKYDANFVIIFVLSLEMT